MEEKYDVFISYRRSSGKDLARIIKPELEKRHIKVFLDFDELKDGVFDKRILDAISSAPVFLIILSKNALDRCKEAGDWVREEILHASKTNRHIVPVEIDKEFRKLPEDLPEDISSVLGAHQWSQVDTETLLTESIDKLVEDRIKPYIGGVIKQFELSQQGAEIHISTDADCDVYRFDTLLCTVHVGEDYVLRLVPGKHHLRFVSKDYPEIDYVLQKYNIPDRMYSDIIDVALSEKIKEKEAARRKAEEEEKVRKEKVYEAQRKKELAHQFLKKEELLCSSDNYMEALSELRKAMAYFQEAKYLFYEVKAYDEALNVEEEIKYVKKRESAAWLKAERCKAAEEAKRAAEEAKRAAKEAERAAKEAERKKTIARQIDEDKKLCPVLIRKKFWFFEYGKGLYGYKDNTGKIVVFPQWDMAYHFNEGIARVMNYCEGKRKFGYIDKTGKVVCPCQWKNAYDFSEGMARVQEENGLWGFIDETGKRVIPCQWKSTGSFHEGRAYVLDEKNKYGFIDQTGRLAINYFWLNVGNFSEGMARVQYNKNGRWGIINKSGYVVIRCQWKDIGDIKEGIARVRGNNGLWGYIDKTGREIIHSQWIEAGDFSNGQALVKDVNGISYLIDKNGKVIDKSNC